MSAESTLSTTIRAAFPAYPDPTIQTKIASVIGKAVDIEIAILLARIAVLEARVAVLEAKP